MNRLLLTMCTVMVSGMLSVSASGASAHGAAVTLYRLSLSP